MLHSLLSAPSARRLVYLLCFLMVLGGQPLMALEQNIRIVPKDDTPDWLENGVDRGTFRDAWNATTTWSQDVVSELHRHLDAWWDGTWIETWDLLEANSTDRLSSRLVAAGGPTGTGAIPILIAAGIGQAEDPGQDKEEASLSEEELKKLAETDSLARPDEAPAKTITKAEPMPNAEGLRVGGSNFRPSKELIQQLDGKADLDNIPLIPGLNLVSLPEEPVSTDPATVFNAIGGAYTKVWVHELCDTVNPWKIFDPNDPASSDLTEVDHTNGFWLEATSPIDLPSDGSLPATTTIQLCPGWNLIGYPAAQPRHVTNALHSIEGRWLRVFGYDASDADDPWEVYGVGVPEWANDLQEMAPGRGYWVLATEATTLTIANEGPDPVVEITSPEDLGVVTDFTDIIGTVQSPILDSWRLTYARIGETEPIELASGVAPVASGGVLGTFDPTLLINGLYELKIEAIDLDGRVVEDSIAVAVEGNMKIGHSTLSFVDLAIPLSGLDIEVVRTYDSRRKDELLDFGYGWSLDIRQGSYQNNRPPGDGWQIVNPGGPFGLPCSQTLETKSHLTTVRLSDQEIYRFRLVLVDTAPVIGGCFARAEFQWVDGPLPGTTLEILGNDEVIYQGDSNLDIVIDSDTLETFVPSEVKLTTRDGRIFHLDLEAGVTHLEDLNGNALEVTVDGITHSSGVGIDFDRDSTGRIQEIVDLLGNSNRYAYDGAGDLVRYTDREAGKSRFSYREHYLEAFFNPLNTRVVKSEYDRDGRLTRHIDAAGQVIEFDHQLADRVEVFTDRLGRSRSVEYDSRGNVVRLVDADGNTITRTYDDEDNILSETDALGNVTRFEYDANGDLIVATDASSVPVSLTYDASGRILTTEIGERFKQTRTYDANGNVQSETNPLGNTKIYSHDAQGQLVSMTDEAGGVTSFEYDVSGNLVRQTDAVGVETTFTHDAQGRILSRTTSRITVTGQESLVWHFEYDALGRATKTTFPDGSVTETDFDGAGRITSTTDALGRRTEHGYDALGYRTSTTFPDGATASRVYDAEGLVLNAADRSGRVTRFAYDVEGRLVETIYPDDSTVRKTYDAAGRRVGLTDARGKQTILSYDAMGRMVGIRDALGNITAFSYDSIGNRVSETDALGNTTRYEYDEAGRLTRMVFPDESASSLVLDALGRITAETDSLGNETSFSYDAVGRLVEVENPLGHSTRYTYDEQSNLTKQRDAAGRETLFEYDKQGRPTRRTLPDGATDSRTYDLAGNLLEYRDFDGTIVGFSYDVNNRLVEETRSDDSSVQWTYTPTGQRASATDSEGTTSYSYDPRDRLTRIELSSGRVLEYSYDANGNRTALLLRTPNTGYETTYAYDEVNRLISVSDPAGSTYLHAYDPVGNRLSTAYPNGVETSRTFDASHRQIVTTTIDNQAAVLQSFADTFDVGSRRTETLEADGSTRFYAYDALDQILSEEVLEGTEPVRTESWSYDLVGNRMSQSLSLAGDPSETILSSYDLRDRLLSAGEASFTWNDAGNLQSRDGLAPATYTWDSRNRLHGVDVSDGSSLRYTYDADGMLVRTERSNDGESERSEYVIDPRAPYPAILAEFDGVGDLKSYYVRGSELLGILRDTETRFVHADGLGSTRTLTDESGLVTDRYSYSPYGELINHSGTDTNPFLFAGEAFEPASGLYYNRARWMDPAQGRFVSMDPHPGDVTNPITLHKYLYVGNDPVNKIDPSGLFAATSVASLGVMGIASGIGTVALRSLTDAASALEVYPIQVRAPGYRSPRATPTIQQWMEESRRFWAGHGIRMTVHDTIESVEVQSVHTHCTSGVCPWVDSVLGNPRVNLSNRAPNEVPVIFIGLLGGYSHRYGLTRPVAPADDRTKQTWILITSRARSSTTLSHELGHVLLGGGHVLNPFNLMAGVLFGGRYLSEEQIEEAKRGLRIRTSGSGK